MTCGPCAHSRPPQCHQNRSVIFAGTYGNIICVVLLNFVRLHLQSPTELMTTPRKPYWHFSDFESNWTIFDPGTAVGIAYRSATMGSIVPQCFVAGGIAGARYNGPKHEFTTETHGKHNETLPDPLELTVWFTKEIGHFPENDDFQIFHLFYIRPSGLPHRFWCQKSCFGSMNASFIDKHRTFFFWGGFR